MSILHSLRRYVDSIAFHRQETENRRKREALPPDIDPDNIEMSPAGPRERAKIEFVCRICGGRGEDRFCLACLAETMEPSEK